MGGRGRGVGDEEDWLGVPPGGGRRARRRTRARRDAPMHATGTRSREPPLSHSRLGVFNRACACARQVPRGRPHLLDELQRLIPLPVVRQLKQRAAPPHKRLRAGVGGKGRGAAVCRGVGARAGGCERRGRRALSPAAWGAGVAAAIINQARVLWRGPRPPLVARAPAAPGRRAPRRQVAPLPAGAEAAAPRTLPLPGAYLRICVVCPEVSLRLSNGCLKVLLPAHVQKGRSGQRRASAGSARNPRNEA